MSEYLITRGTENAPVTIDTAPTRDEAEKIAAEWNTRYGTTDERFNDRAVVIPAP